MLYMELRARGRSLISQRINNEDHEIVGRLAALTRDAHALSDVYATLTIHSDRTLYYQLFLLETFLRGMTPNHPATALFFFPCRSSLPTLSL